MTRAVVVSGAGACGSFEAGVLSKLNPKDFEAAYGTSSGALNATLFSYLTTPAAILSQWAVINTIDDVFQFNWFDSLTLPGVYNNSPLRKLASAIISANTPQIPVTVAVTDLNNGTTIYKRSDSVTPGFDEAVADSATIPVLCCDKDALNLVDGGLLVNLPMQKAIDDGFTELTVILAIPWKPGYEPSYSDLPQFGAGVNAAIRSMDLVFNSQIWSTIAGLASSCAKLTIYAPNLDGSLGNPLDFSHGNIMAGIAKGVLAQPQDALDTLDLLTKKGIRI